MQKALIYARVSSERQVKEGHGLESQVKRCYIHAVCKNYRVVQEFLDKGISGGLFERPAIEEMIQYIDDHPEDRYIVLVDDISRLARDVQVFLRLKDELLRRHVKLDSPNFNFEIDPTPEGDFAELVIAGMAEYHRKQNTRQVLQKMKARLQSGFWAFGAPPGLKNKKHPIYGKVLTAVEPYPVIFLELFQRFRDGRLASVTEASFFLAEKYKEYGIANKKKLSDDTTKKILTNLSS